MNRRSFQRLAEERLQDATVLLEQRRCGAAYYLARYAVECALKACIAKKTKRYDFPPRRIDIDEMYTHDLRRLVKAAGLAEELEELRNHDATFRAHWNTVTQWSEQSRYGRYERNAVIDLLQAITDENHGVLQWVRRSW